MKGADEFAAVPYAQDKGIPYGLSKERSVSALRRLADDIENDVVLLNSVELKSIASPKEWASKTLTLTYREVIPSDG